VCDVVSEVECRIWEHTPDDGSRQRCLQAMEQMCKTMDIKQVLREYNQEGMYSAQAITDMFRVYIIDYYAK
jgi:hypothetical protein